MKEPNFIIKLLASLGVVEITHKVKEQKFVSKTDPITAPLREHKRSISTLIPFQTLIIIVVGVIILLLLISFGTISIGSKHVQSENIPEVKPDLKGTDKERRAFWQKQVEEMGCMELKRMIELKTDQTDLGAFALWEYENNDRLFPSQRDGCYKETGYLKDIVDDCVDYGALMKCDKYIFPRDESKNGCVIHFPKDWFYIDLSSGKKYEDPNDYLKNIHGGDCSGVKG